MNRSVIKSVIGSVIFLLFSIYAYSQTVGETWKDMNGQAHFIFSAGIGAAGCVFYKDICKVNDKYWGAAALTTSLAVNITYELLQENRNVYDVMWGAAGAVAGVAVYMGLDKILNPKRKGMSFKINGATIARLD